MICTHIDKFLEEKSMWYAVLSDGVKVYQDDNRPGLSCPSAWIRLGNYVRNNNLSICEIGVKFRSHIESVAKNKDAYFFSNGVMSWAGGKSVKTLNLGYIKDDGKFIIRKFVTPELTIEETEIREVNTDISFVIKNEQTTV